MSKSGIRTDLAMEAHEFSMRNGESPEGVSVSREFSGDIEIMRVEIENEKGAKRLGKAIGSYVTIQTPSMKYSITDYEQTIRLVASELRKMAKIEQERQTLVVGLGNREITPDAIGPHTVSRLLVTRHIMDFFDKPVSKVCALAPGVLGTTGIETTDIIKGVVKMVKPELVIAVDALAAADISRLATTIQIADTGIQPGAGIGNNRKGLNEATLGVPVIAIGVPTVIDASAISTTELPQELEPMLVTANDIDLVVERMSSAVANGINRALHSGMSVREIEELTA